MTGIFSTESVRVTGMSDIDMPWEFFERGFTLPELRSFGIGRVCRCEWLVPPPNPFHAGVEIRADAKFKVYLAGHQITDLQFTIKSWQVL